MPTVKRFHAPDGDALVLPFGITCINVTDMMAKFLMLAKSTDKMEALMSQKPFWRMFADPNAILALQELSMQILCNVVVEMNRERLIPVSNHKSSSSLSNFPRMPGQDNSNKSNHCHNRPVSVFDFSEVLERTERRVRDDLLGAGPSTVEELRSIAATLATKYQHVLEEKERKGGMIANAATTSSSDSGTNTNNPVQNAVAGASHMAGSAVAGASNMATGMFEKLKGATKLTGPMVFSNPLARHSSNSEPHNTPTATTTQVTAAPTIVDIPPPVASQSEDLLNATSTSTTGRADAAPTIENDWTGVSKDDLLSFPQVPPFHFSIIDDDDDEGI